MRVLTRPKEVQLLATPGAGPADRPGLHDAPQLAATPTFGVEEELLLLDPATGQVAPEAPGLLAQLGGARWAKAELMRFQFEAITDICTSLDQLRAQLATRRQTGATLAEGLGCLLVASGTAPYGTPGLAHLTRSPRYLELARQFPAIVADGGGSCGCHVHVGVGSRDLGVQVLNRLRPWLPTLLALAANAPLAGGRDTGWASWRYQLWARWPTARPPPVCASAAAYDAIVRDLVRAGAALDEPSVYFLARLSPRYPTVEVRVADVCLAVEDAVLLAGLVRALVMTAIDEAEAGVPVRPASTDRIQAATLAAARHGLAGPGLDPWTGATIAQRTLLDRLLDHVRSALGRSGDDQQIAALVSRLDQHGTGATRQQAMRASSASAGELATALARATLAGSAIRSGRWSHAHRRWPVSPNRRAAALSGGPSGACASGEQGAFAPLADPDGNVIGSSRRTGWSWTTADEARIAAAGGAGRPSPARSRVLARVGRTALSTASSDP